MAALATRLLPIEHDCCSDERVIEQVKAGRTGLFEIIMRRYNQRLYRVAYSILRDQAEAEDAIQETYLRAFQFLHQFAGRAKFSTWLTRIAVHEALARTHRRDRYVPLDLEIPIAAERCTHRRARAPRSRQPRTLNWEQYCTARSQPCPATIALCSSYGISTRSARKRPQGRTSKFACIAPAPWCGRDYWRIFPRAYLVPLARESSGIPSGLA